MTTNRNLLSSNYMFKTMNTENKRNLQINVITTRNFTLVSKLFFRPIRKRIFQKNGISNSRRQPILRCI